MSSITPYFAASAGSIPGDSDSLPLHGQRNPRVNAKVVKHLAIRLGTFDHIPHVTSGRKFRAVSIASHGQPRFLVRWKLVDQRAETQAHQHVSNYVLLMGAHNVDHRSYV
ncbi:hypothetical protein WL88_29080 [Burkholderia diffusa]|uniref:Uncharacterized protein n=1 Tax=Burkholderia diffusa TaxID=488732 RepID=A0AAW3P6X2_9BURK|nr:hypothetical protein WL85_00275 [Burkholderia diffusa]KWF44224.1 hypothetical protein WL86_08710 [Burkholderia diffusa]KWF45133.1 hypothetical protein WL88_29080 [Burkholderia diffusa]KWF51116.1 hypothetical protein WL87_14725 [Burkholderia diffusa]